MADILLFLLAFVGGIVGFLSPCNIAMLPTFISYIQGQLPTTRRSIMMSLLYSLGFVLMFTIVAGFFIVISGFIRYIFWLNIFSGIIVICLAVYILISKKNKNRTDISDLVKTENGDSIDEDLKDILEIERINLSESMFKEFKYQGYGGSLLLGISMGSGWVACITPIYLSIVTVAMNEQDFAIGILLFMLFALGIIIPYLILGATMGKFNERFMVKLVKIGSKLQKIFCAVLLLIGIELILSAFGIPGILPFI